MPIRTTEELSQGLDEAFAWLERFGVAVRDSRFFGYRAILRRELEGQGRPFDEWPAELRKQFFAAAVEIFDIIEISGLPDEVIAGHRDKVRQLAIGPSFYDDVNALGNDQGRDTAFELLTASVLSRAGETPTFDNPADVNFSRPGISALIECKRPQTEQGCVNLIIRASGQFSRHRREGHLGVGVVALDFTRLVNPELAILPAITAAEAATALEQQILRKAVDIAHRLAGFRDQLHDDGEIAAVLIRCSAMTIIEHENHRPEVLTQMHVHPQNADPASASYQNALQIAQIIHNAGADRP